MIYYRASWIVPISQPPVRDGWVAVDRGRVVAISRRQPTDGALEIDLGESAILPGLVNAHTHLELSYLREQVPPTSDFVTWVRGVIGERRKRPDPRSPEILEAIDRGIAEALACGTAIVGDISNTLVSFSALARSSLAAVVFYELIRFNTQDALGFVQEATQAIESLPASPHVRASLAAHAPYSVAPLVFRAIRQAVDRDPFSPCSVHLSESTEEMDFIRTGGGPWRAFLEEIGSWDPAWVPPGGTPVQFLDDSGFLDGRVLAGPRRADEHGRPGAAGLARHDARHLSTQQRPHGAGAPPLEEFYESGVRVAIGTDSLASAPDLNLFAELATIRALAPSVPAAALLDSATRQGSRALGFDADFGTIEAGKLARLLAVTVPAGTDDVEEYLVSGIAPEQIRWIE